MSLYNILGQSFNKDIVKKQHLPTKYQSSHSQQIPAKDMKIQKQPIEQIKEVSHVMEVSQINQLKSSQQILKSSLPLQKSALLHPNNNL